VYRRYIIARTYKLCAILINIPIQLNIIKNILENYEIDKRILRTQILVEKSKIDSLVVSSSVDKMICFLISAEDHRFYYHLGFDVIAIVRAVRNKIFYNKMEGASTIEQQLVRVLTNNYQKTLSRKVKEIILAYSLKKTLSKTEIALIYLNVAHYGTNLKGLSKILNRFNLDSQSHINEQICAEIVARLKYPEPAKDGLRKLNLINNRTLHIRNLYKKHGSNRYLNFYGKHNRLHQTL
jgi:membrane carboxypeptidase/penicillin-binding protein PbpC